MVSKEVEEDYLFPLLAKILNGRLTSIKIFLEESDPDEKDCERFEIYFAADRNCGERIDPESVDGALILYELVKEAAEVIIDRLADFHQTEPFSVQGVGVYLKCDWRFDYDEIPEIEAMIGTPEQEGAIVGCWHLAARFAAPPMQVEGKCVTINLPELLDKVEQELFEDRLKKHLAQEETEPDENDDPEEPKKFFDFNN